MAGDPELGRERGGCLGAAHKREAHVEPSGGEVLHDGLADAA
jgi:hypothetical protein